MPERQSGITKHLSVFLFFNLVVKCDQILVGQNPPLNSTLESFYRQHLEHFSCYRGGGTVA